MMIAVDMVKGSADNSFYMAIPSEVTVKEGSYSHYWHGYSGSGSRIYVNGTVITLISCYGEGAIYNNYDLTRDQKNTIKLDNTGSSMHTSGVGWVIVYQT